MPVLNQHKLYQTIFVDANRKVFIGSGAETEVSDIMLTRYACYLIAQYGNPRKEKIALPRPILPSRPASTKSSNSACSPPNASPPVRSWLMPNGSCQG